MTGNIEKFHEEIYDEEWIIPNWTDTQQNEILMNTKTFELKTGANSSGVISQWIIGFKKNSCKPSNVSLYWKLVDIKGYQRQLLTKICTKATVSKFSICNTDIELRNPELNKLYIVPMYEPERSLRSPSHSAPAELKVKLKLVIRIPLDTLINELVKTSTEKLANDFASLLNDESTSDLKIVTSDKKEFFAHKLILKARCHVFDAVFSIEPQEDMTSMVNVEDISGKTMEILLTYFYSGKLQDSWKDPDTIVEFTYAAGKYQMTDVLKILDVYIGIRDDEDDPETLADNNVRLFELANKLSLKHAEIKLVERIAKFKSNI